ncbi:putative Mg2+ transporter-C (MgtC) family protein [Sedimentibacter acidaminivorans]|uniref:Mg2+ transporter-C (MgtC) family protein n=1 Tax=Sedimentibacter acidaminivorans TaxID=913099 RepID=A0ABS4GI98_9FIRM|nr:MgtC/SapB family protein [Sedimentibacter acidaminivorans]MBP1927384.1 putative Mg2+ transporter-C (MgtC) family protein [Sedimentibacter acidaminivorans]
MQDLYDLNLTTISIRVLLSLILGGIIGIERSRKNHPAGFRTYMLVCLSSTLVMMTNQFIYIWFEGTDPARLGAQVISGIGFLGVGTIIVTRRNQVRGLTTAAGLWTSACLGLAIGIGFYEGAIIVGFSVLLIMTMFKKLDIYLTSNNRIITIYASFSSIESFDNFIIFCNNLGLKVIDIEMNKHSNIKDSSVISILNLKSKKRCSHLELIRKLSDFDGLIHIEEL